MVREVWRGWWDGGGCAGSVLRRTAIGLLDNSRENDVIFLCDSGALWPEFFLTGGRWVVGGGVAVGPGCLAGSGAVLYSCPVVRSHTKEEGTCVVSLGGCSEWLWVGVCLVECGRVWEGECRVEEGG